MEPNNCYIKFSSPTVAEVIDVESESDGVSVFDGNPIRVEVSTTDGESKGASISNPVKVESASQPITVKSVTNGESESVSVLDGESVLNPTSASASQAVEVLVQLKSAPNVALALQAIKAQKEPTKAMRMKDITCLSNRRFLFKATFSEAKGDYISQCCACA